MAKNRVTRKQLLKGPDEFFTTTGRLINWAREHTIGLIWGGGIFLALVLFISFYGYFQAQRANTAEAMLGQALAKYQSALARIRSHSSRLALSTMA